MENEENRCLIHKKASKDKLVTFFSFQVWISLIILSLSLSLTQSLRVFLEHSSLDQGKESKERKGKSSKDQGKESKTQAASTRILASNRLHVLLPSWLLTCMVCACWYLVLLLSLAWILSGFESGF